MPNWLGFLIIIAIGIVSFIVGVTRHRVDVGFLAFGIAAIASSVLAWINGAQSTPEFTSEDTFGATVTRVKAWVWFIVFGLFALSAVLFIATRH